MREAEVSVILSKGSFVLKKWEMPCQADLPELIETVKHVKQTINDYLTQLIECDVKYQIEASNTLAQEGEQEEEEEEEAVDDRVSGFIKGVATVSEKPTGHEKRSINYLTQSKKLKK